MREMIIGGVILAGGKSSRMGRPKDLLPWRDGTLLSELAKEVTACQLSCLIVSNHPELLSAQIAPDRDVTIVRDAVASAGPVSGLVTAFQKTTHEALLVLSCDLPFMDREQIRRLLDYAKRVQEHWDVIAVQEEGRLHPLVALYHRRTQINWEDALRHDQLRLMRTLEKLHVHATPAGLLDSWAVFNANTPEEYEIALAEEQKRKTGRP